MFSQSIGELVKYYQNISYGQSDVSKHLAYKRILESLVKELNQRIANIKCF